MAVIDHILCNRNLLVIGAKCKRNIDPHPRSLRQHNYSSSTSQDCATRSKNGS